MDLFAHTLYGVTICSRAGLAGGRKGLGGRRLVSEWTVWCAALFSILPDLISMGLPFLSFLLAGHPGHPGHFFGKVDGHVLILYRFMHSLLVALAVAAVLRLAWKPLFIPSLAWPVHLLTDAVTHGTGKFHTTLFYPLTTWGIDGIRWWEHPEVILLYWGVLPATWLGLAWWRWRHGRELNRGCPCV